MSMVFNTIFCTILLFASNSIALTPALMKNDREYKWDSEDKAKLVLVLYKFKNICYNKCICF